MNEALKKSLNNPILLKLAGGAALYFLGGGSRLARMAGIALAAWGGWDYLQQRPKVIYQAPSVAQDNGAAPMMWANPNMGGF